MKAIRTRRLLGPLLAVGALLCGVGLTPQGRADPPPPKPPKKGDNDKAAPAAMPQPPPPQTLRYSRNIAGDSKPVILQADQVVTWVEKGQRLVLMQGQVLIQHGTVLVRSDAAVAFVNLDRRQRTGILHVDVYAENNVAFEDGRNRQKVGRALLDLNSRGELRLTSHDKKVVQQPMPEAPLFQRAVNELVNNFTPKAVPGSEEASDQAPPVVPGGPVAPPPPPGTVAAPPPGGSALPGLPVTPTAPGTSPPSAPSLLPGSGPPPPPPSGTAPRSPTTVPAPGTRVPGAAAPPPAPRVPGGPGSRLLGPAATVDGPMRQYSVAPRSGADFQFRTETLPSGEQASIFTGGVIIGVRDAGGTDIVDIEADSALVWSRGGLTREAVENLRSPGGQSSRELEFYLAGNVAVRQGSKIGSSILAADEVYLDVSRNVAVARQADLEFRRKGLLQPVIVRAEELRQLSPDRFEVLRADFYSSKLPSDPGIKVYLAEAILEEKRVPVRTLFGVEVTDRRTGEPLTEIQRPIKGGPAILKVENVPVFYLPYFSTDANHPLGPIESVTLGANRIFGFHAGVTLDMYHLLGLQPLPDTKWRGEIDYLSQRGPALGTQYDFAATTFFEMPAKVNGLLRAYGIHDTGTDELGGGRGPNDNHPDYRGRFLFRENIQELPLGFSVQTQAALLSDRNFLEQFYKQEFDNDLNQASYLYLKQQQDNWAWTGLVEPRFGRTWTTTTEWLPRADGYLIGQSFFDLLTYNAHGGIGYARLRTSTDPLPPVSPTDVSTDTGRVNLTQELSLPFYAGPIKFVPYALLDLAYYTQDLNGDSNGRAWGGGGLRASMPLTRLYPDVCSEFLNLQGLNHKIVFSADYRNVQSTDSYLNFPQLDRLNDDATDQALRDLRPQLPSLNPQYGLILATSPLYDPQTYAIRRAVENRIDTLNDLQVVQLDVRQRLQTKRGFPGREHIVDWMTLDVSASLFPTADRDNFGHNLAFLEYDYIWNVGDRTALTSSGWIDPFTNGARVYTFGAYFDRPDRTNYFLGYRQIDPVQSKAVTGAVSYVFSPKYAMTASTTYDFGTGKSLSNSFVITRLGADINVGLGITYNAIQNNFGFTFEIVPSLVSATRRNPGHGFALAPQ